MRQHPRRLALAATLALVASVAGCGDDADGGAEPAPTMTVTATETETDAPEPLPAETVTLEPVTAGNCDDLKTTGSGLAFVVVEQPRPGDAVTSPFDVTGCSNAFEAAYAWRLVDRGGAVLDEGFGSASCGTGCVGDLGFEVTFDVDEVQVASLEVFTQSAEDGSEQDLNVIPVVLTP